MTDIAERAGVSQTTVSFVLSGRSHGGKIADETRQRILQTAEEMGYRRNELARAMVTGRSRTLGILGMHKYGELWSNTMASVHEEASLHGYSTKLLLMHWEDEESEARSIVRRSQEWRVDGIIALGISSIMMKVIDSELGSGACPISYVESFPEERPSFVAMTDEKEGLIQAVSHLTELGHRHISFLSGTPLSRMSERRAHLFLDVLREKGLPVHAYSAVYSSWGADIKVKEEIDELIKKPVPPTALVCAGDNIAMVAMHTLRESGLQVPRDMSVIGFGNISATQWASPPLTSIEQYFDEVGKVAVRRLLKKLHDGVPLVGREEVRPELIVRGSTAPPSSEL